MELMDKQAIVLSINRGAHHRLPNGLSLFDSYHCSRYNTQTKRLTEDMFHQVFGAVAVYLGRA